MTKNHTMTITIEKISNGVIVAEGGNRTYFENSEDLFNHLLFALEGRSCRMGRAFYGHACVANEPDQELTSPGLIDPA